MKLKIQRHFVAVQWLSRVQLLVTPWTVECQASLFFTISQSLPKIMFIELVMPSNHLILCHPLLLLPSIFPSIRVFSNESVICIRWQKHWSLCFSISPSNRQSSAPCLQSVQLKVSASLQRLIQQMFFFYTEYCPEKKQKRDLKVSLEIIQCN